MYMPRLESEQTRKDVQIEFRGYNHNLYCGENEFYDQQNMTSEYYPVMSPRGAFYRVMGSAPQFTHLEGAIGDGNGRLLVIDNNILKVDGATSANLFSISGFYRERRTMIPYGGYVAIYPDKLLFNWSNNNLEMTDLTQHPNGNGESYSAVFSVCDKDGSALAYSAASTAPATPADGDYWIDTSETPNVLKRWSEYNLMWVSVPTTYVAIKISGGWGSGLPVFQWQFSDGDAVKITNSQIEDFDGDYILEKVSRNTIIVRALISANTTVSNTTITVERKSPQMDFVCASNNRLWGCSNTNHEIYACKLGDPKNWNAYAGLSTDSYALTIPEESWFTGCASFRGSVLFFKENKIYKIYGTKPANFQLSETNCAGVGIDCSESICQIDDVLYYAGANGIYAYDGSAPRLISDCFDRDWIIEGASGGTDGRKYYVSIKYFYKNARQTTLTAMYEYDTRSGLWAKYDGTCAFSFFDEYHCNYGFLSEPAPLIYYGENITVDGDQSFTTKIQYKSNLQLYPEDGALAGRWVFVDERLYQVVTNGTENGNHYMEFESEISVLNDKVIRPAEWSMCTFAPLHGIGMYAAVKDFLTWSSETGDIAYYDTNRRYISKIQIRTEMEADSTMKVELSYDHGDWEEVYTRTGPGERKTDVIPIIPHRCDTVRMRFSGTGMCKIFAVSKHYEQGSEI